MHAVEAALVVGDHGVGRPLARRADRAKSRRQTHHAVAMAHPDLLALALPPDPVGERRIVGHLDEGAAEFPVVRGLHLAAELLAHGLDAVADAEHRHAEANTTSGARGESASVTRGRPAGQDDRLGANAASALRRHPVIGLDLAIDPALAHATRDELGHLAAEIEDEDAVGHGD